MADAITMVRGYEPQSTSDTTIVPVPDDWSGFEAYRTFVNASAGASVCADWTYRDASALESLLFVAA